MFSRKVIEEVAKSLGRGIYSGSKRYRDIDRETKSKRGRERYVTCGVEEGETRRNKFEVERNRET